MKIRRATMEDCAGIARVQVLSYRTAYLGIYPESELNAFSVDEQTADWRRWLTEYPTGVLYVDEENTNIVGYALARSGPTGVQGYDSELIALHVLPHAHRMGRHLVSAVCKDLRAAGCRSICGAADAPIWVTETCTFSGGMGAIEQSESDQAADLVKRYVLLWALGVDVVQWCYLTEPQYEGTGVGFFDQSGLVYDGQGPYDRGAGVTKRAYHAYLQMLDVLRDAVLLDRTTHEGLTSVRFHAIAGPVTVLWQDPWIAEGATWIQSVADVEVVGLCGEALGQATDGWLRLDLSLEPVYLVAEVADISRMAPPLQGSAP